MSKEPTPQLAEHECIERLWALIPHLHEAPARLYHAVSECLAAYPLASIRLHTDLPHLIAEQPNALIVQGYAYGWIEGVLSPGFLADLVTACSQVITYTEQVTFDRFRRHHPELRHMRPVARRERQVLTLLRTGLHHRAIADLLMIEESTVNTHVRNLRNDFGAHTGPELVYLADEAGLFHYPHRA